MEERGEGACNGGGKRRGMGRRLKMKGCVGEWEGMRGN